MRRVGVIGCGNIGRPVIRALQAGTAGPHALVAVLARQARHVDDLTVLDDADAFFAAAPELIIEAAGPAAFAAHVPTALARAEVWAVSPTALADRAVEAQTRAAVAAGHHLRIVSGAIGALDGLRALAVDPALTLTVTVDAAWADEAAVLFEGSAREAAARYPHGTNVAVAAALAGPGLDATRVCVRQVPHGAPRAMSLAASSAFGSLEASLAPRVVPAEEVHTVAASLIAALRQADTPLWVA